MKYSFAFAFALTLVSLGNAATIPIPFLEIDGENGEIHFHAGAEDHNIPTRQWQSWLPRPLSSLVQHTHSGNSNNNNGNSNNNGNGNIYSGTSSAVSSSSAGNSKGQFTGDATFYTPEADACGTTSSESDLVAALNAPQFGDDVESDNNPNCGRRAYIRRGSKSVTVRIVDECPECKYGDLDLSPAAFNKLGDPDEGRFTIQWNWVGQN